MKTEIPRPFATGFVLKKTDLDDIHNLLVRQMEGTGTPPHQYAVTYEVRFRYGAIQERATLQDILNEPNGGELSIKGLKIRMEDKHNPADRTITLQLSDVKGLPNPSIYYNISGTDAAWANDADTQLAIKITGIKTVALENVNRRIISVFSYFLLLFLAALNLLFFLPINTTQLFPVIAIILFIFASIVLLFQTSRYFFPSYNFCWGAYEISFKRRRAIGMWLILGVFVAIVLSVFANYISVQIGIH